MTIRVRRVTAIAVASILTVICSTPGFAWYYYSSADDRVWEEVATELETLPVGTVVSTLPNGARSIVTERMQYFVSGENWFLPIISDEAIQYQVVFAPG